MGIIVSLRHLLSPPFGHGSARTNHGSGLGGFCTVHWCRLGTCFPLTPFHEGNERRGAASSRGTGWDWVPASAPGCRAPSSVWRSLRTPSPDGASFARHQGDHCAQEILSGRASDPPLPGFTLALITESGFTTVSQLQATFSAPCPDLPNGPVARRWRWLLTRRWYLCRLPLPLSGLRGPLPSDGTFRCQRALTHALPGGRRASPGLWTL